VCKQLNKLACHGTLAAAAAASLCFQRKGDMVPSTASQHRLTALGHCELAGPILQSLSPYSLVGVHHPLQ